MQPSSTGLFIAGKPPLRFALFYSRAVGMSKSILAQRIRAADWLMIGAEAENVFNDQSELMAELAAIRVLVAENR